MSDVIFEIIFIIVVSVLLSLLSKFVLNKIIKKIVVSNRMKLDDKYKTENWKKRTENWEEVCSYYAKYFSIGVFWIVFGLLAALTINQKGSSSNSIYVSLTVSLMPLLFAYISWLLSDYTNKTEKYFQPHPLTNEELSQQINELMIKLDNNIKEVHNDLNQAQEDLIEKERHIILSNKLGLPPKNIITEKLLESNKYKVYKESQVYIVEFLNDSLVIEKMIEL